MMRSAESGFGLRMARCRAWSRGSWISWGRVFVPTDEPHGTIEVCVARDNVTRVTGPQTDDDENVLGSLKGTKPCAPLPPRPRL